MKSHSSDLDYEEHRDQIYSGDLLAYSTNKKNVITRVITNIIRLFTKSEFSHIGIALKLNNRLYVVEATKPTVRLVPVSEKTEFYHIPMFIDWKKEYETFLMDKIGCEYSVIDGIRAFFGIPTKRDDKWQCAELANAFFKYIGLDFGNNYTPSKLVKAVMKKTGNPLMYVRGKCKRGQ